MPNQTFYSKLMKYQPIEDKGNHVKVDTHTWLGIVVDTWKIDAETPYLQMVGYFNTADGEEILLARKDIGLLNVKELEFFNERRKFVCDLSTWSFHGFADGLKWEITAEELKQSRKVIDPGSPADKAHHETAYLTKELPLYGKLVQFKIKSLKLTDGPFRQRLTISTDDNETGIRRQFVIQLPETKEPFIKMSTYFEQHKALIAETLGLKLEK